MEGNLSGHREMSLVKFDNTISWMDIIALLGVGFAVLSAYFGIGAGVSANEREIQTLDSKIVRIEEQTVLSNNRIEKKINTITEDMKEIRREAASERRDISMKLDRLIENWINKP